jgi:hypothetical protein
MYLLCLSSWSLYRSWSVWPDLTLSIQLQLVHCTTLSSCSLVLHGSLDQASTAWLMCNCLEAVIISFYSLICHQSAFTFSQALPTPSRLFWILFHSFISCPHAPLAQFYSCWSNFLSSSFASLKTHPSLSPWFSAHLLRIKASILLI